MRNAGLFALVVTLVPGCVDAGSAPEDWGRSSGPVASHDVAPAENGSETPTVTMEPAEPQDPGSAANREDAGGSAQLDAGRQAENDGGSPAALLDAAAAPRRDGGDARSDSGSAPPGPDAAAPDDSVFALASMCSSRTLYRARDDGDAQMNPGRACNECHRKSGGEESPPIYSLAGTLYPTGHEPDDCYGAHPAGATIRVLDARGVQLDLVPNGAGNFLTERAFTFPVQVSVVYQGRVRAMEGPVERDQGDCNTCHTEAGREDAPGRIVLP